jgi:hypothetical protein
VRASTRRTRARSTSVARLTAAGVLVAGGALAAAAWGAPASGASIVGSGSSLPRPSGTLRAANAFSISGGVKGLYPGRTVPLVLTVTNPLSRAIVVTALSTSVSGVSAACAAANVTVTRFSGNLRVAARHRVTTAVKVKMLHSASNACQGARFTFHYHGVAKAA